METINNLTPVIKNISTEPISAEGGLDHISQRLMGRQAVYEDNIMAELLKAVFPKVV